MAQALGFYTDTTICIGCKACEVACKNWNQLPAENGGIKEMSGQSYDNTERLDGIHWRHVRFIEQFTGPYEGRWLMMSDVCKHCVQAGCLEVCPTGAIIRTEFDTVVIQSDVCNGCRACIAACPFGVIDINPAAGTAQKCTLCYDRMQVGLEPACAKACPTDSIQFGPVDELRARRLAQFRASAHPLVFTPGDNDWTDCHEPTVKGGDPLERLATLRVAFFAGDHALGRRALALRRQSGDGGPFAKFRENVRWDLGGVTFLTLHVTGSNNGLGRTREGDSEYAERNAANLAWLHRGFAHAKSRRSRAIVVLQQANPFHEFPPFPGKPQEPSGYADLRAALQTEVRAFTNPVVLMHGDSHYFRIDKPLSPLRVRGAPVTTAFEHFTRVEGFGTPYHHWVHVTVDPEDPNVFTFRPRLVPRNLGPRP